MVPHERSHHFASPAAQTGNISITDQIFSVPMVGLAINEMAHVMQQRANFQKETQIRSHFMNRTELVEQRKSEPSDLLRMILIVIQAAGEPYGVLALFCGPPFFSL